MSFVFYISQYVINIYISIVREDDIGVEKGRTGAEMCVYSVE